jgi:CheY-like chemotaxis protein
VGDVAAATQGSDWETQMQREVDSLQNKTPGAFANVNEVVARLLEIANALTATLGIRLRVVAVQSELIAAVHPVLLLQVLVSILKRLAPYVVNGELALFAKLEDGKAKITLSGTSFANRLNAVEEITQRISLVKDITVELLRDELQVIVWVSMPAVGTMTVLVVDDNEDMVRFYRDCTIGTRYNIVHINQGDQLLDGARTLGPDVIVLDIMLPDNDGWHLLMHLHKDQKLRAIPIIISTVVREEELALSLGASYYLAKPVRPRQFIQALDLVCRSAVKEAVITLTN